MRYLIASIVILVVLSVFQSYKILSYQYIIAVDEMSLRFSGYAFQTEQQMNHDCQKRLVPM